jgi:alpha-tubulin suppressor-like RCC1 family protein
VQTPEGKTELWSAGKNSKGLLGQGTNKTNDPILEAKVFTKMAYNADEIKVKEVYTAFDHAFFVSEDGKLYGWGCSINNRLGHPSEGDKLEPTLIEYFNDYIVHSAAIGSGHSLVIASKRDDATNHKLVFSVGREENSHSILGISKEELETDIKEERIIHQLKIFNHVEPYIAAAGAKSSFVAITGEQSPIANVSVHTGYTCEETKVSPIVGTMHYWKDEAGWHYLS